MMSTPRFEALSTSGERNLYLKEKVDYFKPLERFESQVFSYSVMQKMLSKEAFENIQAAINGSEKITLQNAHEIAEAMKKWATSQGATHYCHWFHPLTGITAEKHDSFLEWNHLNVVEKFTGRQLIQGEPDASSFPSGGLRSTFEARGYTGWDPSSPVFVWRGGDGTVLCIPSIFFSWTGAVLDNKIPLLRSEKKINHAGKRLLQLTGIKGSKVYSSLGAEQEYFVIDRALRNLRPDLLLTGRTVIGAPSPKGQELQDHYFGTIKDRILCFMHDFEKAALDLGIPIKTRHNEVAPAQHEVTPFYEKSSLAVDHNILLMEIMRHVALKHNLCCLFHEKPFQNLNGSGKHCNWSISTDTGINLLDPTETPENNLHFLILLTAILYGVSKHSKLLRASVGSYSNDFRLGGHEAPPAIISVYLGEELEKILTNIEVNCQTIKCNGKGKYDLELISIPELSKDNSDRNRTSPFAFTGNKFEFRALGSSASPSMPVTILNLIAAESLNLLIDEIEIEKEKNHEQDFFVIVLPILRKYLLKSKHIRFNGDNYSSEWLNEAKKRDLTQIKNSVFAFDVLKTSSTIELFKEVLTQEELQSRYEIFIGNAIQTLQIDCNVILELFQTQVLPAAVRHQKNCAKSYTLATEVLNGGLENQKIELQEVSFLINKGIELARELKNLKEQSKNFKNSNYVENFYEKIVSQISNLRSVCDSLEMIVEDHLWPLPKYREILYMI